MIPIRKKICWAKPERENTAKHVFAPATALDKEEAEGINEVAAGRARAKEQPPLISASAETNAELRNFKRQVEQCVEAENGRGGELFDFESENGRVIKIHSETTVHDIGLERNESDESIALTAEPSIGLLRPLTASDGGIAAPGLHSSQPRQRQRRQV